MKTTTQINYPALVLFAIACFALPPKARADCREGCDTLSTNTFLGESALASNTLGFANTAVGYFALSSNTTNGANTAMGAYTLLKNTTGFYNTATGSQALRFNTTGTGNTATGATALLVNTTGNHNTASGGGVLIKNTIGSNNTASGFGSLSRNTTGNSNTAMGDSALQNVNGSNNIGLGSEAGFNLTTGSNNIDIGSRGVAAEANTIRLGTVGTQAATFVAGISGTPVIGDAVVVNGNGQLGTVASSRRFKTEIRPMDKTSEALLALQPVTFRYKKEVDPNGSPQFGLVAEEVAKVDPDLVARDHQGKPYTVRYEAVNAMLLNEFLKEHRKVEQQQKRIDALETELKEQRSLIEKVSNQLDLEKEGLLTVAGNQ